MRVTNESIVITDFGNAYPFLVKARVKTAGFPVFSSAKESTNAPWLLDSDKKMETFMKSVIAML